MKKLLDQYRDVIPYAVFGVLTTLINIVVYWLCAHICHMGVMASTVLAWIVSVLFAYGTNRKWVFHSEAHGMKAIGKEVVSFFAARLATGIVDWVFMYVFVTRLGFEDVVMKTLSNIIVIILNYAASKWLVFRHKA